jgi:hypothetical protein
MEVEMTQGTWDSGKQHVASHDPSKPIVINWEFKFEIAGHPGGTVPPGNASLTLNSDGSYNFAGTAPTDSGAATTATPLWFAEFQLVLGVKNSEGSVILFLETGSLQYGRIWNKQGNNQTIKDNWKAFAKAYDWEGKLGWYIVVDAQPDTSGGSDAGSILGDVFGALGGALLALF